MGFQVPFRLVNRIRTRPIRNLFDPKTYIATYKKRPYNNIHDTLLQVSIPYFDTFCYDIRPVFCRCRKISSATAIRTLKRSSIVWISGGSKVLGFLLSKQTTPRQSGFFLSRRMGTHTKELYGRAECSSSKKM